MSSLGICDSTLIGRRISYLIELFLICISFLLPPECDPGTYSLGGGLRFDDWTTIPAQLAVHSEAIDMTDIFPNMKDNAAGNCTNSWIPKGGIVAWCY